MADAGRLGVPDWLLEVLRCPLPHHAALRPDEQVGALVCTECGRGFPVRDGLPIMLVEEAVEPGPGQ